MSRVRAGDLAIIKCREAPLNGRIVEVLFAAPRGTFRMPDGNLGRIEGSLEPHWVVKFIGGRALVPTSTGEDFYSIYGIAPDWSLYPLPGDPESDDESEDERHTEEVPA